MRRPGRIALAAGLVALLFGVIAGFEISVDVEFNERHEKPNFDSHLELATKEKLQALEEYDYLVLSQRWPGTYCKQPGSCCEDVEDPTIFTVNGFWPENDDGSYPSCCGGEDLDQNELDSEVDVFLQHYWPSVSCSSPTLCNGTEASSLYEQEWDKHGSCSAFPAALYFSFPEGYVTIYPLAAILAKSGFVSDSSQVYDTDEMIKAVKDAVGASPAFTCKGDKIYEIQLCVSKDLDSLQDCPPVSSSNRCPPTLVFAPFES